jgi:hypothetical protein
MTRLSTVHHFSFPPVCEYFRGHFGLTPGRYSEFSPSACIHILRSHSSSRNCPGSNPLSFTCLAHPKKSRLIRHGHQNSQHRPLARPLRLLRLLRPSARHVAFHARLHPNAPRLPSRTRSHSCTSHPTNEAMSSLRSTSMTALPDRLSMGQFVFGKGDLGVFLAVEQLS